VDAAWREVILQESRGGGQNSSGPTGRAPSHWREWSQVNNWRERAEAWDAHREKLRRDSIDAHEQEMADLRRRLEMAQHHRLLGLLEGGEEYCERLLRMPPTDVTQSKADGSVTKIKGVAPAQVARMLREVREAAAQLINGHARVNLTGKVDADGNPVEGNQSGDMLNDIMPIDLRLAPEEPGE
jgi:hypothetical protein